jgi:predicted nucleic acid-binding protein
MSFVLDASITITWAMADEHRPLADLARTRLYLGDAVVPPIWWYEVSNMLVVNERRGRISIDDSNLFLQELKVLRIRIDEWNTNLKLPELARKFHLTVYDAAYLDLAIRNRLPLATLDKALRAAAEAAGVPMLA